MPKSSIMPKPSMKPSASAPAAPIACVPDRRIEVAEIVDVVFDENGGHIDLSLRASDGEIITLRVPSLAMTDALARMPDKAVFVLEASTPDHPEKLHAPMGEWGLVQDSRARMPTLECRAADGRGVAIGFSYDPITALPQLQVAVDLRGNENGP
jgi:hypothetical protein